MRPVFIVGVNRSGTTFLHRLMARDERFWVLRLYELAEPVLWTGEYATVAGSSDDPRRARMKGILEASGFLKVAGGVHHFDVDEPEEDFPIFRMAFSAWVSTARFHIPEYGRWMNENGSRKCLRLSPPHPSAFHLATPPASSRAPGAVAAQDALSPHGARRPARNLSRRPVHPDPPRAHPVHGLLEQPGGTGTLPVERATAAARSRRGAVGLHERHARQGRGLPARPPGAGRSAGST